MHCTKCGAANVDGATTCAACGSPLTPMPMAAPTHGAMAAGAPGAAPARPVGVTVLAVLYFIGAGFLVLAGLAMFALGGMAGAMAGMPAMFGALGAMLGVVALLLAALAAATGWGMWTAKPWAWILALVLTGLNALSNVLNLASGDAGAIAGAVFGLAIAGLIIWYLLRPEVKRYFGRAA